MATKKAKSPSKPISVASLLRKHFRISNLHQLVTASRSFPIAARVDLQCALLDILEARFQVTHRSGVQAGYAFQTFTFSMLSLDRDHAPVIAPLEYEDVDIGEAVPVRCLKSTVWLCNQASRRLAILLTPVLKHNEVGGWQVEIAMLPQGKDHDFTDDILHELERQINQAQSYRGKVISLEQRDNYSGKAGGVRVHKLRVVTREQVILPEKTLQLLERNVSEFIEHREQLHKLGMSIKKGLLFYGPPGTGKTHTIHYLASQLPDHTTLLITADQVGLLDEYMQLARFLQPAMVILEDVDLIARARTSMRNSCEEGMLNKLLNEMDGLREDAALLFVLTTNRPEELEAALAARPGRVDQAIEFPLPDVDGRRKLIRLYAGQLQVGDKVVATIVKKTQGASAAFIKELMRRSAQFMVRAGGTDELDAGHVEGALDEMLFAGGSLNVKLLGGAE
ncbi:MAG: ATP-binding protein [Luteolibacter sp.]|uniref:ATP-binding protein n=1 Tax=Luteolibacter sp. TaxID=1962973 RepID=UPI0032635F8E